ncbi:MAG: hypothetical protein WCP55_10205, partial [Lentisphaerota bacterium]
PPVSFNRLISTGGTATHSRLSIRKNEEKDKELRYTFIPLTNAFNIHFRRKNLFTPCGIKPLPGSRYLFLARFIQVRFSIKPPSDGGYLY